jgi:hypothetical protein
MEAAHQVAWDATVALQFPDFIKKIGNRLHTYGVLKHTALEWPARMADVEEMDLGDLQDLPRLGPAIWAILGHFRPCNQVA